MAIAMGSSLSQPSAILERHITIQSILSIIFLTTSTSMFSQHLNLNNMNDIKDPNKSNTQKYFRHSNVKRYELALLRSGYFIYFGRLHII